MIYFLDLSLDDFTADWFSMFAIVDFRRNQRKYQEQLKSLTKDGSAVFRNELWRAECTLPINNPT
jgi:hypothetical protein